MKSHYIEGTNQQYSIREDGILIRHYSINRYSKEKQFEDKEIHGSVEKRQNRTSITFVWRTDNKRIFRTQGSLLVEYFGYKLCKIDNCNGKVYNKDSYHCKDCLINNMNQLYRSSRKLSIQSISKHYVATKLGILLSDLTDEVYNLYKANLKVKRLISDKTGKHINTKHYEST